MKNKGIILLVGVFTLIIVAGLGIYSFFFIPNTEVNEQLHEQFSEGFFDFSDLNFEEESLTIEDSTTTSDESNLSEGASSTPRKSEETTNTTTIDNNQSRNVVKPSVKEIEDNYSVKFTKLQNAAVVRLDELFNTAYREYKDGHIKKADLVKKYVQAGEKLQNGVDTVFYELLGEMESELIKNNLPTNLVNEAETIYKEAIKRKKKDLLSKL